MAKTPKKASAKKVEKKADDNLNVQPKYDENGVPIDHNVFPPIDDDVVFEGTGAGQRQVRNQKEAND